MPDRVLNFVVLLSGMAALGIELAASRLFAPFFGTSLLIWANLIGLILIYLSAGYYIGGRWADRDPRPETLYRIVAFAGFFIGILPFVAAPVLQLSGKAFDTLNAGLGIESFVGTLILFAVPVTLLGCVTPFALRLSASKLDSVGRTAGRLYALSTIGSILGVYLTVFVFIPNLGTRRTFLLFSLSLLLVSLWALWKAVGLRRTLPFAPLAAIVLLISGLAGVGVVKASPELVYETESPYNFVQVLNDNGTFLLTVNEGQAYQSAYHPGAILLGGYWDLVLVAPYFTSKDPPRSVLIIGLAAGTIAKQYSDVFPDAKLVGVEIDPSIIDVGRRFFAMNEPNLTAVEDDGRAFLHRSNDRFDLIVVDAYHQPYIPFHLTTVEFYSELALHLSERGMVVVNAARTPTDDRLVTALAATMRQVYPSMALVEHPNHANTLILASPQKTSLADYKSRLAALQGPILRYSADIASSQVRPSSDEGPVFTDDHAPVEELVDSIILNYLRDCCK